MKTIQFLLFFLVSYPALFSSAEDGAAGSGNAVNPAQAVKAEVAVPAPPAADYTDMALVPEGEFLMGSGKKDYPNEQPRHKVFLDAYFMDKYEVTAARYRLFAKAAGKQMPRQSFPDKDNFPVVFITWQDARAYCEYYGKYLPTEAQWEKAAQGGSEGSFCFGDEEAGLGEYAWYWNNSGRRIHPVGRKKPNGYGLYDMHGNVLEWTADWYDAGYYASSPAANPPGPEKGSNRVIRGGSAFVSAELCRSASRMRSSPDTRYSVKGFRCAAPAPKKLP